MSGVLGNLCKELNVDLSDMKPEENGLYQCAKTLAHRYDNENYDLAAGRILSHIISQSTPRTLRDYVEHFDEVLNDRVKCFFLKYEEDLTSLIREYEHLDSEFGWLAISSISHNYLLRRSYKSPPYESIGIMWMRVMADIFAGSTDELENVKRAFIGARQCHYVPASPFMFSAGTKMNQHRSCFLWSIQDNLDSILNHGVVWPGIISKNRGGCGFSISRLRNSEISNIGFSDGIMPWLKLFDQVPNSVNQSGKRKGAVTVHIRSHHLNLREAISSMEKTGNPKNLVRHMQLSVMFSWLFWERFKNDEYWTLFCPALTEKLNDVYGIEFEKLYLMYESDTKIVSRATRIKARELAMDMCSVQVRSAKPYVMNFDGMNFKSNHRHMGLIRSSNLCLEIIEHFKEGEIASCNLHSISLRSFVQSEYDKTDSSRSVEEKLRDSYDFQALGRTARQCVRNLDRSIDVAMYPLEKEMKPNNVRNRPLSIGVSGLANAIYEMDLCFESSEVVILNKMIFACIYYNALVESVYRAVSLGPCEGHAGSPMSEGKLQFDLWREEFDVLNGLGRIDSRIRKKEDDDPISPETWGQKEVEFTSGTNLVEIKPTWESLKRNIMAHGLRNTLTTGIMPTATSSQVVKNYETVECPQSNMFLRRLGSGDYPVVNLSMIKDLRLINAWNRFTADLVIVDGGSMRLIPKFIKAHPELFEKYVNMERLKWLVKKYRTVWEIPSKVFFDLAADRARYVDQSMSSNIYMKEPSKEELCCALRYCFNKGLKTIMYYLRMSPNLGRPPSAIDPLVVEFARKNGVDLGDSSEEESDEATCESCQ